MSMDVIHQREFLRISHKKTVYDKDGNPTEVEDLYPISVELDNQYGYSEKADGLVWDDTNQVLLIFTYNQANSRGADYMMGQDTVLNPCMVIISDYDFIQELKVTVDLEGYQKIVQKAIDAKMMVNYRGKEVPLTQDIAKNIKRLIFDSVSPRMAIERDKKLGY